MIVHSLGDTASIANRFMAELRDEAIQKDRLRFRYNLTRLGEIMAYEISKTLMYRPAIVKTSLGSANVPLPQTDVVLMTVLRAGLPFLQGFQNYFDKADVGFIGAFRKEGGAELSIQTGYVGAPSLENKTLILIDTMLATGKSIAESINTLTNHGKPAALHLASVIAAPEGIDYLRHTMPAISHLWTFSIDERLNGNFYIVPGLGDAGDLSFGEKL